MAQGTAGVNVRLSTTNGPQVADAIPRMTKAMNEALRNTMAKRNIETGCMDQFLYGLFAMKTRVPKQALSSIINT